MDDEFEQDPFLDDADGMVDLWVEDWVDVEVDDEGVGEGEGPVREGNRCERELGVNGAARVAIWWPRGLLVVEEL